MERQVLSVKISNNLYWQLKNEVGRGKISYFIEQLVDKELNLREQKLAKEYQEASQDKKRWAIAKEWEATQMNDWNQQDVGENN